MLKVRPVTYTDGKPVLVGDVVELSSFLGEKTGEVIYVCDIEKPLGPNGKNDYGISIRFENGEEFWGLPDKKTKLISRR